LYFPRYHQLDVVRKLIADAGKKGTGQTYLIQHSAGSGKSNSITWAAYQLIETYPESDLYREAKVFLILYLIR
jgi:type I restriction enzyme R subunit